MHAGIGIDGCRAGWLVVQFDGQKAHAQVISTVAEVGEQVPPEVPIWIDMPIGLVDQEPRGRVCDQLARRLLSPLRHSSIFTPPCRVAAYAPKEEASALNQTRTTKKLSRQSLNILPEIQELDRHLQALPTHKQLRWHEAHPEVVFAALQDLKPLRHNKRTILGQTQRQLLLKTYFSNLTPWLKAVQTNFPSTEVKTDDILDALALAVGAYLVANGEAKMISLPDPPLADATGLPMRIVYAEV